jgi:hypothetical protein
MTVPERSGLLELLDHHSHLKTPVFQRSFAWAKHQVDDYWGDLLRAASASPAPEDYFLGLVVLDEANEIQDGQQRLAATLLLASAIYAEANEAKKAGAHDEQLATDAIAEVAPALRSGPAAPLVINAKDQTALLSRAGVTALEPESTRRLRKARAALEKHLAADVIPRGTPDARLGRLRQWGEFLRVRAYVVVLRVPTRNAHNIFETVNTRGVRLSNADLAKSHLISRASETQIAVHKWQAILDSLKNARGDYEAELESFLLHYFGSAYRRTTKAEFFDDYRAAIASRDPLAALDDLVSNAELYHMLAAPAERPAAWQPIGVEAQNAVELLNALGLKQLRYLLLAVLRDLGGPTAAGRRRQRDAIVKVASWSVRALVHGLTGGGEAEKAYIDAAAGIRSKTIKSVAQLRGHFESAQMLPANDKAFEERFANYGFDNRTNHRRAAAVLYALERHLIPSKSSLGPRDSLTVEHVLPRSPQSGQWSQFSSAQRLTDTYKLGNLLLVDGPSNANDQLANKEWPEKRALIRSWKPLTPLTAKAVTTSQWSPQYIERRTKSLAKLATEAWAL